jgi:hypothetical protein
MVLYPPASDPSRDGFHTPRRVRRAIVVFVDLPATRLHRLLRGGFRHCFVLIDEGSGWILIDPLKHRMEVRRLDLPETFDLAAFYARRGHHVMAGTIVPNESAGIILLECTSCVTVVKRVLALFCPLVQTPYQLYRHLQRGQTPFVRVEGRDSAVDSGQK